MKEEHSVANVKAGRDSGILDIVNWEKTAPNRTGCRHKLREHPIPQRDT